MKLQQGRDLGVTYAAATKRPVKQLSARLSKTRKFRIKKISRLASVSRNARKLFTGSAYAAATWGHQATALSDSQVIALERDALNCAGIKTSGRCRTMGLLVAYGKLGTPRARIIRETIKSWFELMKIS